MKYGFSLIKSFVLIPKVCLCLCVMFIFSCSAPNQNSDTINYSSFYDVPGITEEEIAAIEYFQQQGISFIYGTTPSTELFIDTNGELKGFTVLLCQWLSELFGIPFIPQLFEWDEVLLGLESGKIDFTGELTATTERRKTHFMTDAIANRFVSYFRIADSAPFSDIERYRPLRFGFFSGTITYDDVLELIGDNFTTFFVDTYEEAYRMLASGQVDAILDEHTSEAAYEIYGNVISEEFFPFLFGPVSLSTRKPENAIIISVIDKILQNDGTRFLRDMYNNGENEYKRHKLFTQLTEEEKAYIKNNPTVKFVAEHDNYPISFYNTYDKKFQGICYDVLKEIEVITGLTFQLVNNQNDDWTAIIKKLEDGDASMISELIRIPEREDRFLWPKSSILTDYYALLSKDEYRNIRTKEIMFAKVGLIDGYTHSETFIRWFPDHTNTVTYDNYYQAFDALRHDEVDMVMGSQNQLLVMTNFYELPGYKANIVFDYSYESTFGFNKNEAVLCSIIDKALNLLDTKGIEKQWTTKTYDYRIKIAQARLPWLIGAIGLLFCVFTLILFLFYRSKRYVQIQEESKSKSLFLANMSHEIRTPMNAITGMAEMLLRGDLSDEMRCYAQDIKHAGKNLISIINDILDISKIEAGKMEIMPVNYMFSSLINDTVNIIRARLTEKLIWFETDIDKNIPNSLIGDEVRLRQIILNLLSNAVKYTNKGGIKFSVKIERMDDPSSVAVNTAAQVWLNITVTDTGRGIKPEDQAKLFSKFVQVDKEKNIGIEGTGLGLAITKQLVEAMGGSIGVQSEYGTGSTFTVIIPQNIASFEPVGEIEFASSKENENNFTIKNIFPNSRILIVDDLPVNLKVAEGLLAPYKAVVDVCSSGEEAVELVKYKKFDLIFMDHMMNGMDGMEATARIRTWEKDRTAEKQNIKKIPIVALTANAVVGMKEQFIKNGFDDFLAKPIDIIKLDEILNRWIEDKEQITDNKQISDAEQIKSEDKSEQQTAVNQKHDTVSYRYVMAPIKKIRNNYRRLILGLFVLSFGIVLAVSIAANYLIAFSLRTMEYNIEQRLRAVAERLAESVSIEELDQYREVEDMELPSYQALRFELAEYSEKTELLYVYYMRPQVTEDGQDALYYIIDNDFNEETRVGLDSPTDHILDEIPWLKPVLEGETVYAGLGIYTEGWDGLLSAYAPIYSNDGEVEAVAGVDIEDTVIVQARRVLNILTVVQVIMVIIVFITGMFALIRFRKEADAAAKANAIKDDFLSKMSYELLNPMNAITGMTELVLRTDIPEEARNYALDIKKAGADLTSIIQDILYFSQIGAAKHKAMANSTLASLFNVMPKLNVGLSIKGVDTARGIAMTGKTAERYKQVLSVFSTDAQERLPLLQTVPQADDMKQFIIQVHTLKSALATIGAQDLSVQAAELEEAGRAENLDIIRDKLPAFAEQLSNLINDIDASLAA